MENEEYPSPYPLLLLHLEKVEQQLQKRGVFVLGLHHVSPAGNLFD
jgi:hypothetical protein